MEAGKAAENENLVAERAAALLVDGLILMLPLIFLVFASILPAIFLGDSFFLITILLTFVISLSSVVLVLGYHVYFESRSGRTPGKKFLGIRVVKEDGSPCDLRAASIRNLLRFIDGMLYYSVGLIMIIVSDRNQRLGDMAAGTVVVSDG